MSICNRVVKTHSRWDGKEILMGTSALIDIEKVCRDKTGCSIEVRLDCRVMERQLYSAHCYLYFESYKHGGSVRRATNDALL
jgi:hypothetical protein